MRFMIHSCNSRLGYVKDMLVPSMIKQGINHNQIAIFNDDNNDGCLKSWVNSCCTLSDAQYGLWHMQDNVVICDDFLKRIQELDGIEKIINGFVCKKHNPNDYSCIGFQNVKTWWASFQCVYIPAKYIQNFPRWFTVEVIKNGKFKTYYDRNRHADFFFYRSVIECFPDDILLNLCPCLVDHIDYKLDGSVITPNKNYVREALYWNEPRGILKG